MSVEQKGVVIIVLACAFLAALTLVGWVDQGRRTEPPPPAAVITPENADCVACHRVKSPGIVDQWKLSAHAQSGIGCFQCHQAEQGDIDAYRHEGSLIATIVSPRDCGKCHEQETLQFDLGRHAQAADIAGSPESFLAEVFEGSGHVDTAIAVSGCWQCHGSEVRVLAGGKLDPATWPNTGVGRINPDGSKGSCSACHMRHSFSRAQARAPENCGRCHLGPDHSQFEAYTASMHGVAFIANRTRFEPLMKQKNWIPGVDFEQGPTCSTCHMGATKDLPVTHNLGDRISWTHRPPISERTDAAAMEQRLATKSWRNRRDDMQQVCESCHFFEWVDNWYEQYDNMILLYNDKFARPATELYEIAKSSGLLTPIEFDEPIELSYFALWHREGRQARNGVAMMSPAHTQWYGMYEVAHRFYTELVPQFQELAARNSNTSKAAAARRLDAKLREILASDHHRWYTARPGTAAK